MGEMLIFGVQAWISRRRVTLRYLLILTTIEHVYVGSVLVLPCWTLASPRTIELEPRASNKSVNAIGSYSGGDSVFCHGGGDVLYGFRWRI